MVSSKLTYYSCLPHVRMPERDKSFFESCKPFYSGKFNNGAVFLGDKENIKDEDVISILRLMGSFVRYKGCNDKKNAPFLNTIPSFIVNFANSSRLSIVENAYKILYACQRSVQDPECPTMHDETFSLFKYESGDIGIIVSNHVSASMHKRTKYESGVCVTSKTLVSTKCSCRIGNKVNGNKILCIHNLPLVYSTKFLFYDGFAQHLLLEIANRWDNAIEKMSERIDKSEIKKDFTALMRAAGEDEEKIQAYATLSSFSAMLDKFSVGTHKSKLRFYPKPSENEVMPL